MATDGVYDEKWEVDQDRIELEALRMTESFALGVAQTVSAAGLFGIVSQIEALTKLLGPVSPRIGLTFFALSLGLAVVASLLRFHAKLWHVKSRHQPRSREWAIANTTITVSRGLLTASVILIAAALLSAVLALWLVLFELI